jgi:hypothetical protein
MGGLLYLVVAIFGGFAMNCASEGVRAGGRRSDLGEHRGQSSTNAAMTSCPGVAGCQPPHGGKDADDSRTIVPRPGSAVGTEAS